uniref:hypothetical protein n=1 Tax=Alcaligenes faecalis TaxID=511 RepID=UPI00155DCF85|nr:hypothetical protein [Alcaligenes faecalis]
MHNASQPITPQTAAPIDIKRPVFWQIHLRYLDGGDKHNQCLREAFAEVATLLEMPDQCPGDVLDEKEILLFKSSTGYKVTAGPDRLKLNNVCSLQPLSFGEIHVHHGIEPLIALWYVSKALSEADLGDLGLTDNESQDIEFIKNFSDLKPWITYMDGSYDAWHQKVQDVGLLPSIHQLIKPGSEDEGVLLFF